jgi:sec-independent protein translocase protein TatB
VFNIQGGELIFLLLIALLVLGPEKLPDAIRKFTRAYTEFKKMANGFQGELKQVLDEPMRELRETAGLVREATDIDLLGGGNGSGSGGAPSTGVAPGVSSAPPPERPGASLNFGNAAARRAAPRDPEAADSPSAPAEAAKPEPPKPAGLNFGDASKRRRPVGDEPEQVEAGDE